MPIEMLSIGLLAACAAFFVLAYAFYLESERRTSVDAKVVAIAFAFCGVGSFAQMLTFLSQRFFSDSGLGAVMNSLAFNLLFNGLRPWVMLLAAICALRFLRSIPN